MSPPRKNIIFCHRHGRTLPSEIVLGFKEEILDSAKREREIGERSPFRNCFRVQLTRKKYFTEKRERLEKDFHSEIVLGFSSEGRNIRQWEETERERLKKDFHRQREAKRERERERQRENRNRQDRNLGVRDREGDEAEAAGGLFGRCHPIRIAQGMPKALFPY